MLGSTGWFLVLIGGILLMAFASDKAVEHSVFCASILGMSQLMIGLMLVSLGTDLPEIVNSIISCSLGHADVDAGDSVGSVLAQLTLVLGILPIVTNSFEVKRSEIVIIGSCLVVSLIALFYVVNIGFSRLTALLLVGSWPVYMIVARTATNKIAVKETNPIIAPRSWTHHFSAATLGFVGVAVGAYAVVQAVMNLSAALEIPEFLISFFIVGIGTSLPELAVDVIAIRKGAYEVAIGDIIGSCIVDASFSISIGQVFFPQPVSVQLATTTIIYAILASIAVICTLVMRKKVDRKAGLFFLAIYLLSYPWIIL